MSNRFIELLQERKLSREKGNSLVVYVLWMPLLFGSFGVAVDMAVGTYTNTTLQSALDTGTQSALSRATNPGTGGNKTANPQLTSAKAHEYFVSFYDANRTDTGANNKNPFLKCQTTAVSGGKLVTPPSRCRWTEDSFRVVQSGRTIDMTTTVNEISSPIFIHILNIHDVNYKLTSSARVTYAVG